MAVRVLPAGWVAVPSKSRPGEMAYKHTETGTRSAEMPTLRNQQMLIDAYLVEVDYEAVRAKEAGDLVS